MNQLGVLIIILTFSFHGKAQNTTDSERGVLNPLHPSLAVVIAIIPTMLSITTLVLAYAKFCQRNPINLFGQGTHQQNFHELIRSRSRFSGIDLVVIDSLPFFRFSSLKGSKEGLECAVCISRFEDTEILRLLPKCKHAFHKNCIDQWLQSHSSCPLCRYKFNPKDLKSITYSNSLRYLQNPSNLTEDPRLELFVQREHDHQGSSRFNLGSSIQIKSVGKNEELLIQGNNNTDGKQKLLHKFKHKIIFSDVIIKNRWSDVNSSDLLSINSEMLSVMSSKFFPLNSSSARFYNGLSMNENIEKIKEDIERKRLYEYKFSRVDRSNSVSTSSFPSTSYNEENSSKMINPAGKRSMSEITNFSRFRELTIKNKFKESASPSNSGREERMRRLWLPIARRTVQWFANREKNLQELEYKRQASNV